MTSSTITTAQSSLIPVADSETVNSEAVLLETSKGWWESVVSGDVLASLIDLAKDQLLPLLGGIVILLVGWIVAKLAAKGVRAAVNRTGLATKAVSWFGADEEKKESIEQGFAKATFWLIMLFVLVAFFQALRLTEVTGPLQSILDQIVGFLPQIFGAGILVIVALALASVVKLVVSKVLGKFGLDGKLAEHSGDSEGAVPMSETLAASLYWFILILFLPMVLEALGLQGLMAPVNDMIARVLEYLPQVFGAAFILLVGWFIARIVQRLLTKFLTSIGLDKIGERVGLTTTDGRQTLSGIVGIIAFSFIVLLILVSALNTLDLDSVTGPATTMIEKIFAVTPSIISVALVLTISVFVGRFVAGIVQNLLVGVGFDNILVKLGVAQTTSEDETNSPSAVVAKIVFVGVMFLATVQSFDLVGLGELSDIVRRVLDFSIDILLAVFIFAAGMYFAKLAHSAIVGTKIENAGLLATLARGAILILSGIMALRQTELASEIVVYSFVAILGAVCVGAAIALGIAFGKGGQEAAGKLVGKVLKD